MYEKKISRQCPGLIAFMLDDSGSMGDLLPGTSVAKHVWVERYTSIILKDLLSRSTELKGDEVVIRPRYYVLVVLYGSKVEIWGDGIMDIGRAVEEFTAANNSLGLAGNLGGTDAKLAAQVALDHLKDAILDERFKDSFPPMLFHLTDGKSRTDARPIVDQIKALSTADGSSLIVNAFIGTETSLHYNGPEDFPGYVHASEAGPSEDNIRMFEMSCQAPESICENLIEEGIFPQLRTGSRLFFDVRSKEQLKNVIQVVGSIGSRAERMVR